MAIIDLLMPKLGESIMEATILKWHKQAGDSIAQDETLLDIATDKVDSEVPSTAAGILEEILFNVNDVVPIGTVIARIKTSTEATNKVTPAQPLAPTENITITEEVFITESVQAPFEPPPPITPSVAFSVNSPRFYSPLVLNIAQQEGISMAELEIMPGTGQDGRVTKKDILAYLASKPEQPQHIEGTIPEVKKVLPAIATNTSMISNPLPPQPIAVATASGGVEIIEMDRMRKLIAKHMVDSKHTSAHVTSFAEADVTSMVLWREKIKKEFEKREGTKITFTPLFIEAVVNCLKQYPLLNSSIDGDRILVKKDINMGMATALPSGNLIVPVIKNADQFNLVGLTKQVNQLADAARNGKLRPDDTTSGTFTLTNVGSFGSLMGTPIISQPQVAIMAVGAIKKRPVVIETAQGDSIAIRHMMYISLSYDHRIIDGALGSTFLSAVARTLENWDIDRTI